MIEGCVNEARMAQWEEMGELYIEEEDIEEPCTEEDEMEELYATSDPIEEEPPPKINWSLACVIVVAESKWGYEPLRRSGQLVKGARGVAASTLVLYGQVFLLMVLSTSLLGKIGANRGVLFWMGTLIVVYGSSSVTGLILYSLAPNVVLYIYCKALHEKGALLEIAEVEGKDNASLAFGGGKGVQCKVTIPWSPTFGGDEPVDVRLHDDRPGVLLPGPPEVHFDGWIHRFEGGVGEDLAVLQDEGADPAVLLSALRGHHAGLVLQWLPHDHLAVLEDGRGVPEDEVDGAGDGAVAVVLAVRVGV
nr:uncharacterized protein LOC109160757 [Ipomoea batatas]